MFVALGLLALVATPVLAAGLWPNLPIVGGASYCGGFSTGVSGQVCTTTVPAGPSIVTGNETIPADTNAAQGVAPQTVKLTLGSLNALPVAYTNLTPATASNSLSPAANTGGLIVIGTAALSATTIQLPPSPIDGQEFKLSSTQTIASLTVNAVGATVSNAPTAMTVSTTGPYGYLFRYRANGAVWYRLK